MDNGTHGQQPEQQAVGQDSEAHAAAALSLGALQRRRLLLRGVGKGGAVIAAAVPMQTFAANILRTRPANGDARLCTLSGVGSMLPSSAPRNLPECSGITAAGWADPQKAWPVATVGATSAAFSRTTPFNAVFTASTVQTTFGDLMLPNATPGNQTWARAYLNALVGNPLSFPYSPAEVVQLYAGSSRVAAELFFTNFV